VYLLHDLGHISKAEWRTESGRKRMGSARISSWNVWCTYTLDIDIAIPSVRPSVRHTLVLCKNGATYRRNPLPPDSPTNLVSCGVIFLRIRTELPHRSYPKYTRGMKIAVRFNTILDRYV